MDELKLKLIRLLEDSPKTSQRDLSKKFKVSLGSVHYCLKALIEKGFIKAKNFSRSNNKLSYAYIVTPSGIRHKTELTISFLKRKQNEYEKLKNEIKNLEKDLKQIEMDNLNDK